ncbi:MAG: DNA translocase FtsK, partial [Treponema sp.]|nr:DNA translocase FtsK [Treponema sp.]
MKSSKIYKQTAGKIFNYGKKFWRGKQKLNAIIENPKIILYACAGIFFLLSVIFSFSIAESLFGQSGKNSFPGNFFVDSYGILSFIIPAYLVCAALILIDKSYKPSRIFILSCIIFPFLTLATGFSILRDYNYFSGKIKFFSAIGRHGFSFFTVSITALEGAVIYWLSCVFFPAPPVRRPRAAGVHHPSNHPAATFKQELKMLYDPIRGENMNIVREVYTNAFKELQNLKPTNFDAIDAVIENLEPNLDVLNAKLKTLNADITELDAKLDKLDTNLDTLKTELSSIETEPDTALAAASAAAPARVIEVVTHFEETESITEFGDFNEIPEFETVDDLEKIIGMVEAEAAIKTDEAINNKNRKYPTQTAAETEKEIRVGTRHKPHPNPQTGNRTVREGYSVPVDGVLKEYTDDKYWIIDDATYEAASILKETLREFNIQAEVTGIRKGPVITMFEILPSPGVKLSKIVNLQDNIALRLAASSVRIVAPIPGKHAVGIEIPNKKRNIVSFREIIEAELSRDGKKPEIPVVLGKDITGESVMVDLATMPHLLIAGATGAGKSVCVNTMILSILYQCRPSQCRLILIDPKIVELKLYNDIPHLLTPVITEPKRAFQALQYCVYEMERRYACLDSMGARDIKTYNRRIKEKKMALEHIPYIVIVIDEFADLMATTGKELESTVARLAAMSRAVGIHLVLATQRPSIDVITGLIKSNIPSRIAFMVASMMDSRIIIDMPGAEKLLGKGDMLYSGIVDPFPVRMQGAFVSEEEVEAVVAHVKTLGEPDYIDEEIFFEDDEDASQVVFTEGDDPLYDKALEIVIQQGKASASYIQRRLKIGYNRAARLVEEMEHRGVVGPAQGSKPRELLRA